MDKIACFYHPTMTVFVDDNESYLSKIAYKLDTHLAYVRFSTPQEVLAYVKKHSQPKKPTDIKDVLSGIYTPTRFNIPSVIVLDYSMPKTGMNGFELCSALQKLCAELHISLPKIILLTGKTGGKLAIEGVAKGHIDKYISKQDPDYGISINKAIQELQTCFFQELFQDLAESACLIDPHFIDFFRDLYKQHNIVEHYLISRTGNFLLLQKDGSPLWLAAIDNTPYRHTLVKTPDLVPIQREKISAYKYYLEHIWPPR